MAKPQHAMEIFRLLDQSNCRECGEKTCLAFAGAVFQGRRDIGDCPRLAPDVVRRYAKGDGAANRADAVREAHIQALKNRVGAIDFGEAAARVGGRAENGKLTVRIMGKDLSVDRQGKLYADIHVNPWVALPFLDYVLNSRGQAPAGIWVPFRELDGGKEPAALFEKRCEEPMKRLADSLPDFFADIVHMFSGRRVQAEFASDISVVLAPLPKVPLMICYWKPDEGLQSSLNLFFDQTATQHLDIGSIFSLGAGLSQMFGRLALRHGFSEAG